MAVLDVSGRGGNLFFLTLFDRHPEVACCPVVQYYYSYLLTEFGDAAVIDAGKAHRFVKQVSYFRLLYNDLTGADLELFTRIGGDPNAPLDRNWLRKLIDAYFADRQVVSRRELVLAPLLAYAIARGMDLEKIKFVLVGDAISLREETVTTGFSGRVVDAILSDFSHARLFQLVRDPRATFASPRHQFVNALGNMYAIKPGCYLSRLRTLLKMELKPDNGCVYLYWLLYLRQTERAVRAQLQRYPGRIKTIRNEDLNLEFSEATRKIAEWAGIDQLAEWHSSDFIPTICGAPWAGTGAYNSRYQRATTGLLANDPDDVASRVTGPNSYVTKRWRTRLNSREIELIERLFRPDIIAYRYEFLYDDPNRSDLNCLLRTALLPFEGELPTYMWLRQGAAAGWREFFDRLFYALTFPPFYAVSRVLLFNVVLRKRFFRLEMSSVSTQ